jgi:cell division protein FtsL
MSARHDNLVTVIGGDLFTNAKLPMLLLVVILATAMSIISVTFNTRILMDQREQLILEQDKLNVEWRNLILEEEVWGKQNRVLQIATERLNMNYVELEQESVVIEKQER